MKTLNRLKIFNLKQIMILPAFALLISSLSIIPSFAALGDDWQATASGLTESAKYWRESRISTDGSSQVAIDANSVYVSRDYGISWSLKYTSIDSLFDLDSSDDGSTIVISYQNPGNGILLISKDYGQNWTTSTPLGLRPIPGSGDFYLEDFAVSTDGNKIFTVTSDGRFFYSLNTGLDWSLPTYPTAITDQTPNGTGFQIHDKWRSIDISGDGESLVVSGEGVGVKVSTDLGQTWKYVINNDLHWKKVSFANNSSTIVVHTWDDGYQKGLLNISTDGGETFSYASCALTPDIVCIDSGFGGPIVWSNFALSANGTKIIAIGNTGESAGERKNIYISGDQGVHWSQTSLDSSYWTTVSSDTLGINLLAVNGGQNSQMFASHDSGLTWNPISTGIVPASYPWIDVESSSNGQYMYANREDQEGNKLFKSADYGATWANTNAPGFNATNNGLISVSTDGSTIISVSNSFNECFDGLEDSICASKILKSIDYGKNWTTINFPDVIGFISISSSNDGHKQVANAVSWDFETNTPIFKLYVSLDFGDTWEEKFAQSSEDSDQNFLFSISMSGDGNRIIASTVGRLYYISINSGDTWERFENPTQLGIFGDGCENNFVITKDGSKIFAITINGVFVSLDLGITWSESSIAPEFVYDGYVDIKVNEDGTKIGLAEPYQKIIVSENSGQSWKTIFNLDENYSVNSLTAADDFSTFVFSTDVDIYVSHSVSLSTAPANDSGSSVDKPAVVTKKDDIKEIIEKLKDVNKEVDNLKPGTLTTSEPLIMRLLEDLPTTLKPQFIDIFTEDTVINQTLDLKKALDAFKQFIDKILVNLPSSVIIDGQIQASRLVVLNHTTMQLVTDNGGVISVQANDGENPIPVDQSGKVQMVRSNGVETKGVGLSPNSEFSVYLFSDPTLLGVGKADTQGSFNASFLVDKDFPLGNHTLQINGVLANGKTSSISMPVSVVESVETATSQAMTKVTQVNDSPQRSNNWIILLLISLVIIGYFVKKDGLKFIQEFTRGNK